MADLEAWGTEALSGSIGIILGLCRGYIGVILGLYCPRFRVKGPKQ